MGFLDVMKAIGGGLATGARGVAKGADFLEQAQLEGKLLEQLGPDYKEILEHQSRQREQEQAMMPGELEQQQATIESTEAGTEGARGRESRASELFPGQKTMQEQQIEAGDIANLTATGELQFQPTEQRQATEQHKITMAQAGANPSDIDGSLGEVQKAARDRQETQLEYQKALVNQINSAVTQKGLAGEYTTGQIARMVENAARGVTGSQKDLTDDEVFNQVMEQVMQAIELQSKLRSIPGVMKN